MFADNVFRFVPGRFLNIYAFGILIQNKFHYKVAKAPAGRNRRLSDTGKSFGEIHGIADWFFMGKNRHLQYKSVRQGNAEQFPFNGRVFGVLFFDFVIKPIFAGTYRETIFVWQIVQNLNRKRVVVFSRRKVVAVRAGAER